MKLKHLAAQAALLSLSLAVSTAAQAALYAVQGLGALGGSSSAASSINDHGVIVGDASLAGDTESHAFIYESGVMKDIGPPGGLSHGNAINNAGQVVGNRFDPNGSPFTPTGFVYAAGAWTDLDAPNGNLAYPRAINDAGVVVGETTSSGGESGAFVYRNGVLTHLGLSGGFSGSDATAINSAGDIAGYGSSAADPLFPFILRGGVLTALRDEQGRVLLGSASDISDQGAVVGQARFGTVSFQAFLYQDGVAHNLGTLGGSRSAAYSLNERGQVVGSSWLAGGIRNHAFIYTGNEGMQDLNSLIDQGTGWELVNAVDINEAGQIVGWGYQGGLQRAFVLTPVPEAPALAMLALAAPLVFSAARRRARARA